MKKRFKGKHRFRKLKVLSFILVGLASFSVTINVLRKKVTQVLDPSNYIDYLLKAGFNNQISKSILKSPLDIENISLVNNEEEVKSNEPLIYIYNTHDEEAYYNSYLNPYNIVPDVKLASYYFQERLKDLGIESVVEKRKIKDVLDKNGWNYRYSYNASRVYLEEVSKNNPSIKYFIDLHRDSVGKDKTTTTINGKSYARVMFLVGLEHKSYQKNLDLATRLNELISQFDSTLSRGIYQKEGPGVNGIYNQDFSSKAILIEVGGQYNTIEEVANTIEVIARVLKDYLGELE
ncbi:stage II sporulation protein P [Coprobacillus sp. CAG:605]|nr:stage II sporulation protein P [Coprobacillus sp. CAG:605]